MPSLRPLLPFALALSCTLEGLLLESRAGAPAGSAGAVLEPLVVSSAQDFVDSVGVSVRLEEESSLEVARAALLELGVRHARAFAPPMGLDAFLERAALLGEAGVNWQLIIEPRFGHRPELAAQLIGALPTLESIEGPNDYDAYGLDLSAAEVEATLRGLRTVIDQAGRSVSLVDALDSSKTGVGDVSDAVDYGNLERFRNRQLPGRMLTEDVALERAVCGNQPIFVSECGYSTLKGDSQSVTDEVVARYVGRTFLSHFEQNLERTYWDELRDDPIDQAAQSTQGLLREDGSRKPAFHALRRLLALASDPGPSFEPPGWPIAVRTAASTLRHVALQRRDGTRLLAVWNEVESFDPDSWSSRDSAFVTATIQLAEPQVYAVYRPLISEQASAHGTAALFDLMVPDDVLVVTFAP